jgi:hypothetical protein
METRVDYLESNSPGVIQMNRESRSSGVSWGAVIGGAFAAAALYLILLALGAGFGLSVVSLWPDAGLSASTVGTIGLVWLIVCEVVASALGGYLTGRLRTKWALLHNDEVFFRDTANGFLAWAVALAGSAVFLASAAASMAGVVTQARPMTESTGASTLAGPNMYFVDTLFRSDRGAETNDNAAKAEAERILANDLKLTQMPASDQSYLARLVATRTGIAQAEAEKRVADVISDAREKEDAVRKATARLLLWLFVSLMLGAFIASYAATIGGRQRDHVKAI